MEDIEFAGFGLRGYRSFGGTLQLTGSLSKVHLIAGQNNVGKSNLLRFAFKVLQTIRDDVNPTMSAIYPDPLDRPDGWKDSQSFGFAIGIRLTQRALDTFGLPPKDDIDQKGALSIYNLLNSPPFRIDGDDDVLWLCFELPVAAAPNQTLPLHPSRSQFEEAMDGVNNPYISQVLDEYARKLSGRHGNSVFENFAIILDTWAPWQFIPAMSWVEAVREITKGPSPDGRSGGIINGRGLIEDLAKLQSPDHATYDSDYAKYESLNSFIASVLDDEQARLIIPDSKRNILVKTRDGRKPIENLGTGISELIVIAASCTVVSSQLICIEEPEVHLHPTLQRKLLYYLNSNTDNRYIMTTHSASMLNSEIASISHVTMSDGWSAIQTAALPRSVAAVAADLGNRASDLVQSNFVIWVEGPSDRIYISHWLNSFSPDLIEGAHYSVMFYGGALLNHLTADDQEITDFINLNRINRNFALIIDSDRKGPADQLTRTKQRVISECDEAGSYLWVTDGYTIENYIPKSELQLALDTCYPLKTYRLSGDRWKSPLGKAFAGVKSLPSKVTIARSVTSTGTKVKWLYGLEGRIDELVSKIRAANDLNR